MFCINCGKNVEEGAVFCTNCVRRIKADPVVTIEEQAVITSDTTDSTAVETTDEPAQAFSTPPQVSTVASWSNEPVIQPVVPETPQKEKVFFGKGALAFCLVVIGLLAISTGVFAGLYFSVI